MFSELVRIFLKTHFVRISGIAERRHESKYRNYGSSILKNLGLSDMEREDYQKRINDLLDAVSTLLDANRAMGEKLDKTTAAYDDLKAVIKRMESQTGSDYPECEQAR